jgi:hypothetical protein
LEDLKVDSKAQVLLKEGHLEDRLEDWKVDLKAQVLLKAGPLGGPLGPEDVGVAGSGI